MNAYLSIICFIDIVIFVLLVFLLFSIIHNMAPPLTSHVYGSVCVCVVVI